MRLNISFQQCTESNHTTLPIKPLNTRPGIFHHRAQELMEEQWLSQIDLLQSLRSWGGLSTFKYRLKYELGRNGGKSLSRAEHHRQRGASHQVSPAGCCKNISSSFSPWESQWSPRASPGFLPKPYENTIVAWFQHIIWHRLDKYRAQVHRL